MSVNLVVNGNAYPFPNTGDELWGDNVTNWAIAVTSGMLQKAGGVFALTAEVDFGASFGVKTAYIKSRVTNPAAAGLVRMAVTDVVAWRNNLNNGDLPLAIDASDNLLFNGNIVATSGGGIVWGISNGGTGKTSFVAGDIVYRPAAGTTLGGLAIGLQNQLLVVSGSLLPSYAFLTNAMIDAAAAIARSKLAVGTANFVVINSGAGAMSEEATLAKVRGGTGADNSAVTFPSTGSIVTAAGAFALTNKDYDGGVASNTLRLTLPANTTTNISGLTRKAGTLFYDTTLTRPVYDDGTNIRQMPGRLLGTTIFQASGTWTKATLNPSYVRVTVIGGGGGSGGTALTTGVQIALGGAGGGGGTSYKTIQAAALGTTETVTCGAGGTAGAAGANAGGNGGTSSFGAHATATGGTGGGGGAAGAGPATTSSGVGGLGASGDLNLNGGDAIDPIAGAAIIASFSFGGSSQLAGGRKATLAAGAAGYAPGGGASGATAPASTAAARAGAIGGIGWVIVEEYA